MDAIPIGSTLGKVWGSTLRVFRNDACQVEVLKLKKGFRCSTHKHVHRVNLFHVISGRIRIRTHKDGLDDETVLGPGQTTVVKPGDAHRFEALAASVVLEIYFVDLSPEDIVREDSGGRLEKNDDPPRRQASKSDRSRPRLKPGARRR